MFHGVEINSIKVGNSSRRDTFYGGDKNLTRNQDLVIDLLVHVGEDDALKNNGQLQSLLEYPITFVTGHFLSTQSNYSFKFKRHMVVTISYQTGFNSSVYLLS